MTEVVTYSGVAMTPRNGDPAGWDGSLTGTVHAAPVRLEPSGSATVAYPRGGSTAHAPHIVDVVGWLEHRTGEAWPASVGGVDVASLADFLAWFSGTRHASRMVRPTAVYRQGDRLTYVGTCVDLAGRPLSQVRLLFIGETVQDNAHGAGTNLAGVFVAYLPSGDTYDAFAFSPATGVTWHLDSITDHGNSVTIRFRQVTRSQGYGEGLFLGAV